MRLNDFALMTTCPFCGAEPHVWCFSPKSGKRSSYLHSGRLDAVQGAWYDGYLEGMVEMADRYEGINDPEQPWATQESWNKHLSTAKKWKAEHDG